MLKLANPTYHTIINADQLRYGGFYKLEAYLVYASPETIYASNKDINLQEIKLSCRNMIPDNIFYSEENQTTYNVLLKPFFDAKIDPRKKYTIYVSRYYSDNNNNNGVITKIEKFPDLSKLYKQWESQQPAAKIFYYKGLYGNSYDKIDNFSKAIELDPNFADAYLQRGKVYYYSNIYLYSDEVISDFTKIIELNPKNAEAYFYRGVAYLYHDNIVTGYINDDKLNINIKTDGRKYKIGKVNREDESNKEIYISSKEKYELIISDFSHAIELGYSNKKTFDGKSLEENIIECQAILKWVNNRLVELKKWEDDNLYDSKKFIIVSKDFRPVEYEKIDLFAAVAAANKRDYSSYISDVVFVSQNGANITFKAADNAISRILAVDSRTGLTAGQKVRIYYRTNNWHVDAIEKL